MKYSELQREEIAKKYLETFSEILNKEMEVNKRYLQNTHLSQIGRWCANTGQTDRMIEAMAEAVRTGVLPDWSDYIHFSSDYQKITISEVKPWHPDQLDEGWLC